MRVLLDFDGTLNQGPYTTRFECNGEPKPEDVARVAEYRARGYELTVFTARLSEEQTAKRDWMRITAAIQDWTAQHFDGWRPAVSCIKSPGIIIDNHAIQYAGTLPAPEEIEALTKGKKHKSVKEYDTK